jgi:TonB family protein
VRRPCRRAFGSAWEWKSTGIGDSLLVLLKGPAAPRGWPVGPYFPDAWIRGPINWRLVWLSGLLHILVILFPLRWRFLVHETPVPAAHGTEVAWMGGSRVLLPYIPALRAPEAGHKAVARRNQPAAKRGAPTFHPRQTIVSNPEKATHPRQTLIEPAVAPEPPKILTPLPNIVEWPNLPQPAPPRRRLRVNPRTRMRQKAARPQPRAEAPEIAMPTAAPDITIASAHPDLLKPVLVVKSTARPTFAAQKHDDAAAPDIAATINPEASGQKLIALSETPAPPPPDLQVPAGNLNAQFVSSPEGKPGDSAASSGLPGNTKGAARGGTNGVVPGVAIVGGRRGPISNIAGPAGVGGGGASGSGFPSAGRLLALHAQPGVAAVPGSDEPAAPAARIQERIRAGVEPEQLLEPGRVYTLHINMPNLASATGTWTLKFVELDERGKEIPGGLDSPSVAGPVPLRKVDPKYPPSLVSAKVQGDVILYAIIRRDGSVDSIEIVKSVDPQLDRNAMEALARWRFQAAQREGRNVELATIVRIPFRAISPME